MPALGPKRRVDQRLRMLDPEADRERLGLDIHAALVQHLERVARAVADRQHQVAGGDPLAAGEHHAAHLAAGAVALDVDVDDLAREAVFAAQRDDVLAHLLDHLDQPEGADVRLADIHDFLGRAGLDELGQHLAAVVFRVLDLAIQLAVRKGAGAAFAELDVRLRIEFALAPEAEGVDGAFAHHLAALEDQRAQAHLGQDQRGEQAARAGADDDRALVGVVALQLLAAGDEFVAGVGRRHDVGVVLEAGQHRRFVAQFGVDRVDQHDGAAFARVVTALEHGKPEQGAGIDAEARQQRVAQRGLGMVERKF